MDLPSEFVGQTKPLLGEEWDEFLSSLSKESPTSIRLNKRKSGHLFLTDVEPVPWCSDAYYLSHRPQFTFDPLLHAGCYYVQEASSMFIRRVFEQYVEGDVKILDLCAAPGGKSTLLLDAMSEDSLLVSNEVIRSRAHILSENLLKWGNPNVIVTNNDPAKLGELKHFFDIILVDAPCSGEGMFRKDKEAVHEWSLANVQLCKERQRRIVSDAWDALKPEGLMLYSTCTYNTSENEDNVQWIADELGAEILLIAVQEEWGISGAKKGDMPVCRFFPHRTKGEGFFLSLLQKGAGDLSPINIKKNQSKRNNSTSAFVKDYICLSENFDFMADGNSYRAFRKSIIEDIRLISSKLNTLSSGIYIGELKGKDFIPSQSLAMSDKLNMEVFNICEVDWQTAMAYLKRELLILPDQPKGYVLLTYRGKPLGFVKNIGNRANNLYPQEWRIRSNNLPESEVNILNRY